MRRWITCLALGLLLVAAGTARAEPDEGAKLVARELMSKGRAEREAKDYRGALESFSKAHAIMHVPTTLVEAARARADAGLLLEALELLHELGDLPPRPGEPAPFARARTDATELGRGLEERIPSLRIDLAGSPQPRATELWIDGVVRPDCMKSCHVNPGTHVVVARAPSAMAEEQLQINERDSQTLELVFSPTRALTLGGATPPSAATRAPQGSADRTRPRVPVATWVSGGVALGSLGAGVALGFSAVNGRDELRRRCAPACAASDVEDVRRRAIFANVAFGVALSAAALAATTYVMGRPSQPQANDAARSAKRLSLSAAPDPQARGGYVSLGASF
jgi:hypothetical protein